MGFWNYITKLMHTTKQFRNLRNSPKIELHVTIINDEKPQIYSKLSYNDYADDMMERSLAGEYGYEMPGTAKPHAWCGLWQTLGCLNHKSHKHHSNTIFLRQYKKSCFRASCRICYKKWAARQALAATKRFHRYQKSNNSTAHLIKIKLPNSQKDDRDKIIELLTAAGCKGGTLIFAPFEKFDNEWVFAPAYYAIIFGKLKKNMLMNSPFWAVEHIRNFEEFESENMYQTIFELVQRCGIKKGTHSFVWFGHLSYRNLVLYCKVIVSIFTQNRNNCPLCHRKLRTIYYEGFDPPIPDRTTFEGFVRLEGWHLTHVKHQMNIWYKMKYFIIRQINHVKSYLYNNLFNSIFAVLD